MLLDEPTAGMGHDDVDRIVELIRRVRGGPHHPDGGAQPVGGGGLCDSITVLTRGAVLAEGDYADGVGEPRRDRRPIWERPRRCLRSPTAAR